jgi:hypothetical protein
MAGSASLHGSGFAFDRRPQHDGGHEAFNHLISRTSPQLFQRGLFAGLL